MRAGGDTTTGFVARICDPTPLAHARAVEPVRFSFDSKKQEHVTLIQQALEVISESENRLKF